MISACEKLALLILLGIYPSLCGNTVHQNTDWPMFMHDLHHTGYSPSPAPDSLYPVWEFDTGQRLFGSPVVSDGTVYQVGRGVLFALNAETGDLLWSSSLPVVGSTPFIDGQYLYVGTCNGIAALNAETGDVLWQVQLAEFECDPRDDRPTFLSSSPIVTPQGVIMCTCQNYDMIFVDPPQPPPEGIDRVVCVDSKTGALVWDHPFDFSAGYSPVFTDGQIIINSVNLEALDDEGQELWSYPDLWVYDTSPVVSGNALVTVKYEGVVSSIDLTTHTLLWRCTLGSDVNSTPAVYSGKIVVAAREGSVVAIDEATGNVLWKREVHEKLDLSARDILRNAAAGFLSSPAIADNKIYVGLWSGTFLCLGLETGEILWQYKTGGSIVASPAVADEKVFIASTDGKLYCFGIDPETYFEKARRYEREGDTGGAREFYSRALDYYESKGNQRMVQKCESELEGVSSPWIDIRSFFLISALTGICGFITVLVYLVYRKMHRKSS